MQSHFFDMAAVWVLERQNFTMSAPPQADEIVSALEALHTLVSRCDTSILIPDLLPGTNLEALYVAPASDEASAEPRSRSDFVPVQGLISTKALTAIGAAIEQEFATSEQDFVRYEIEGGGEAFVYALSVRDTVLKATGLTLLGA